jgi:hypothetical protein
MTEFKKVTALCQEVEQLANQLLPHSSNDKSDRSEDDDGSQQQHQTQGPHALADTRALHALSENYRANSDALRQRTDKLLAKARETDPNRQSYNEATCLKIEALGTEVDRVLALVTEARLDEIAAAHLAALRAERAHQAAAESTAASLAALEQQEKEARLVLADDGRIAASEIFAAESDARTAAYRREAERAATLWAREQTRRKDELALARAATVAARANPVEFVRQRFAAGLLPAVPSAPAQSFLIARLKEIVDALTRDPEQEGLRTMRCDAERFVKTFGHTHCRLAAPSTGAAAAAVGQDSSPDDAVAEHSLVAAAEAVFFSIGYEPTYTASPMPFWAADVDSFVCDATKQRVRIVAGEVPWLQYGDRRLTLVEPAVAETPDEWMAWHDTLKSINEALQRLKS